MLAQAHPTTVTVQMQIRPGLAKRRLVFIYYLFLSDPKSEEINNFDQIPRIAHLYWSNFM